MCLTSPSGEMLQATVWEPEVKPEMEGPVHVVYGGHVLSEGRTGRVPARMWGLLIPQGDDSGH